MPVSRRCRCRGDCRRGGRALTNGEVHPDPGARATSADCGRHPGGPWDDIFLDVGLQLLVDLDDDLLARLAEEPGYGYGYGTGLSIGGELL